MKIGKMCLAVTAAAAVMTTAPRATSAQVITFDERGNIIITGLPFPAIPGSPFTEPFSGLSTLSYVLPFPFTPGDVWISETPDHCNVVNHAGCSDLLRFIDDRVFVFSDEESAPEPGVLADTPFGFLDFHPGHTVPTIVRDETGVEGNNGLFGYTPLAGEPGSYAFPGLTYNFISDGVVTTPEPGSLLLTTTGAASLALFLRRRARANRSRV